MLGSDLTSRRGNGGSDAAFYAPTGVLKQSKQADSTSGVFMSEQQPTLGISVAVVQSRQSAGIPRQAD